MEPNDAATTAPTRRRAEQPRHARDRVVDAGGDARLLFSAPASTAAVSGATVIDSPSANTSSAGSTSET